MPFVPDLSFGYPELQVRTSAPTRRHPRQLIQSTVRSILIDRIEAAVRSGVIDLHDDPAPTAAIAITTGELARLLEILLPEEYAGPTGQGPPTATAPGSAERIAVYAARRALGQAIANPRDRRADGAGQGVRVVQRSNGSGPRVVGWEDE